MGLSGRTASPFLRWSIILIFCGAFAAALIAFKVLEIRSAMAQVAAQPEYSETVETSTAQAAVYRPTIKAIGISVAPQQIQLRNERAGYIALLNAPSGAQVQQDQILIQLDISEEQANLASAKARAKLAQGIYEREKTLRKSNAISQEALDRARANVDVLKAEIAATQSIIDKKTIRAPFTGTMGIHQLEKGQFLEGNTDITTLVGNSEESWIDFSVPQFYPSLELGSTVQVRLVTTTEGDYQTATLIATNPVVSPASRSRLYRASLPRQSQLLHNTAVEVEVPVGPAQSLVAIDATAIQSDGLGQYVFKLVENEQQYRAQRVTVSVAAHQGEQVYVSGLTAGTLVAAAGAFKLFEGILVNPKDRPQWSSEPQLSSVEQGL